MWRRSTDPAPAGALDPRQTLRHVARRGGSADPRHERGLTARRAPHRVRRDGRGCHRIAGIRAGREQVAAGFHVTGEVIGRFDAVLTDSASGATPTGDH
jgi:hypothetical protein